MITDLTPFASQEEMLDAVLEALPPGPETAKLASPAEIREHELLVRGIEEIRQGRSFAFDDFDLNADTFYEIAEQGKRAFAAGLLGLPYTIFAGLTTLMAAGLPALAIIMAELVPQAEHGLPIDTLVLRVYAVLPLRRKDGDVLFDCISRALIVATVKDSVVLIPVDPPIDKGERALLQIPPLALFVMLTVLADDRPTIRRTVVPVKLNDARALRGRPLIPPMWTVSGVDLIELCSTTVRPKQPPS